MVPVNLTHRLLKITPLFPIRTLDSQLWYSRIMFVVPFKLIFCLMCGAYFYFEWAWLAVELRITALRAERRPRDLVALVADPIGRLRSEEILRREPSWQRWRLWSLKNDIKILKKEYSVNPKGNNFNHWRILSGSYMYFCPNQLKDRTTEVPMDSRELCQADTVVIVRYCSSCVYSPAGPNFSL